MAFPATIPADGTRHIEDGVPYIVRGGRWQKLTVPAGVSGGVFANKSYTEIDWGGIQDRPRSMILIKAAMTPKVDANIDVGFFSRTDNKYIESATHYDHGQSCGLVNYGDGGVEALDWNSPNAFHVNGFWLANFDNSTRFSAANRVQMATIRLLKTGSNEILCCWEFYQQVNYSGHPTVINTCKMPIKRAISDLTKMFFRVDGSKQFASGRATVEIF